MPVPPPNSISLGEAAVRLGEHPFLTFQRLSRGQLRGFKRGGRWQVEHDSLERLITSLTVKHQPPEAA